MPIRSRVALDLRNTRCVVFGLDGAVAMRLTAYQMACVRRATQVSLRNSSASDSRFEARTAWQIADAIQGVCCYAFYCHSTDQVKIGRSNHMLKRWAKLELEGGRPLQLIAVWKADNSTALERALHQQFADYRQMGEWFSAEPVIDDLRNSLAAISTELGTIRG